MLTSLGVVLADTPTPRAEGSFSLQSHQHVLLFDFLVMAVLSGVKPNLDVV